MKFISSLVVTAALLLAAGCATTYERDSFRRVSAGADGVDVDYLAERLLAKRGVETSSILLTRGDSTLNLECVRKSDGTEMKIVMLTPAARFATVTVTAPHHLKFDCLPQMPWYMRSAFPDFLLLEMALVELDPQTVRMALGDSYDLTVEGHVRTLSVDGKPMIVIRNGTTVEVQNHYRGYGYTVTRM